MSLPVRISAAIGALDRARMACLRGELTVGEARDLRGLLLRLVAELDPLVGRDVATRRSADLIPIPVEDEEE